jgi:pimeloyl-ACP methyl ester carboxylesterase
VPDAFYDIGRVDVPVLVLSGGLDPATPPRHGATVAERLGRARHVVATNLGHGISGQSCAPRLITRFIRDGDFRDLDFACLEQLPAARFFAPIEPDTVRGVR